MIKREGEIDRERKEVRVRKIEKKERGVWRIKYISLWNLSVG